MGIPIFGYEAKDRDFVLLEERKRAQELKKEQYREKEPVKDKKQELRKDFEVIEVKASDLFLDLKNKVIPELQTAKRKTLNELKSLGFKGSPDDLLYIHGAFKRWEELPTDAELKDRAFEILGGRTYHQQKEQYSKADAEVRLREKKLEALTKESKKSLLRNISLTLQKNREKEELKNALRWRGAAEGVLRDDRQKLSTGDNKDRFNQTYDRLLDERRNTEQVRTSAEQQHTKISRELTEAYELKHKLEALGQSKMRFIFEKGKIPRPENEIELRRELSLVQERQRKLGRGGRGL